MNENFITPEIARRLAAESAIQKLLATYATHIDSGNFPAVADLLQHAELDVLGTVASGGAAIKEFLEAGLQVYEDGTPRTWHTVANALVEIDPAGTAASSVSYYTVHQQLEGFALQPICTGKYLDQFELHNGQWRFARRAVTLHLVGDLSHHVKGANGRVVANTVAAS